MICRPYKRKTTASHWNMTPPGFAEHPENLTESEVFTISDPPIVRSEAAVDAARIPGLGRQTPRRYRVASAELAACRIIFFQREFKAADDFTKMRPRERHGANLRPVKRVVGAHNEDARFVELGGLLDTDRCQTTASRAMQTPVAALLDGDAITRIQVFQFPILLRLDRALASIGAQRQHGNPRSRQNRS